MLAPETYGGTRSIEEGVGVRRFAGWYSNRQADGAEYRGQRRGSGREAQTGRGTLAGAHGIVPTIAVIWNVGQANAGEITSHSHGPPLEFLASKESWRVIEISFPLRGSFGRLIFPIEVNASAFVLHACNVLT